MEHRFNCCWHCDETRFVRLKLINRKINPPPCGQDGGRAVGDPADQRGPRAAAEPAAPGVRYRPDVLAGRRPLRARPPLQRRVPQGLAARPRGELCFFEGTEGSGYPNLNPTQSPHF